MATHLTRSDFGMSTKKKYKNNQYVKQAIFKTETHIYDLISKTATSRSQCYQHFYWCSRTTLQICFKPPLALFALNHLFPTWQSLDAKPCEHQPQNDNIYVIIYIHIMLVGDSVEYAHLSNNQSEKCSKLIYIRLTLFFINIYPPVKNRYQMHMILL